MAQWQQGRPSVRGSVLQYQMQPLCRKIPALPRTVEHGTLSNKEIYNEKALRSVKGKIKMDTYENRTWNVI